MLEALRPSSKVKFKWFFHFSSHFYYILNETLVKKDDVLFMHFFSFLLHHITIFLLEFIHILSFVCWRNFPHFQDELELVRLLSYWCELFCLLFGLSKHVLR